MLHTPRMLSILPIPFTYGKYLKKQLIFIYVIGIGLYVGHIATHLKS